MLSFKVLGFRAYTPSYQWIRGYVDLNIGYTVIYGDDTSHNMGLDFSAGIQIHKHIAIGYNLNFIGPNKGEERESKEHWAKITFLF